MGKEQILLNEIAKVPLEYFSEIEKIDLKLKEISNVIHKNLPKSNKFDREKIKGNIKKELKKLSFPGSYENAMFIYLGFAIYTHEPKAKDVFEKILYEDFKNTSDGDFWIPFYILQLEGLYDLVYLDFLKFIHNKKINGQLPFSSLIFKWVRGIASRAKYEIPILIIGDTGTSKEAVASAIHKLSNRRDKPYIEINCAAIPENLLESELFGHEKGAFTGATDKKKGTFEHSHGGVVFLDEIGKMPKFQQAKLLRAIEQKKINRVGGDKPIEIDVRFIAATQDDDKIIPELKSRLGSPYVIKMPTLNERLAEFKGDKYHRLIMNSLNLVLSKKLNIRDKIHKIEITEDSFNLLEKYQYDENYRELENILMAAVISANENNRNKILPEDLEILKDSLSEKKPSEESGATYEDIKLKDIIDYADKKRASIVEKKVTEIISGGRDIKTVLIGEGLPEKKYQGYLKKIKNITKKEIRKLKL